MNIIMSTVFIDDLEGILADKNISKNSSVYLNIDKGFMVPEYILYRACKSSVVIKNKIIKNTKRMEFNNSEKLIPVKHNYREFLKACKNKFKSVYFVTNKCDLANINMLVDFNIEIVSLDKLKDVMKTNDIFI